MLRFKAFLLEKTVFSPMTRYVWFKYGDKRLKDLIDVIKNPTNPATNTAGKDLNIKNTQANIKAIEDFIDSEDTVKTFTLELEDGSTIESNKIGKSPVFGGQGAGAGATGNTAEGESLQCLYLEAMLSEGKNNEFPHFTPELLEKYVDNIEVDVSYEKMMKAAAEWHYSAYVTAKHLIEEGFVTKQHKFHRGSITMKAIYAMKKTAFKNSGKPVLTDDKWNPGDIWAVRSGVDVKRALDPTSIETLNATLAENFVSRDIVGISLKQINKLEAKVKHEVLNMEEKELDRHVFTRVRVKAEQRKSTFWSGKGAVIFFDRSSKADMRAPSALAAINLEIILKGARGGRAGYSQLEYAANTFLNVKLPTNAQLKTDARTILRTKKAPDLFRKARAIDSSITQQEFDEGLETATIDRIHAKLGVTTIAHALHTAKKKQQDDFMSYVINYAGSKLSDSSVYVKVSAA